MTEAATTAPTTEATPAAQVTPGAEVVAAVAPPAETTPAVTPTATPTPKAPENYAFKAPDGQSFAPDVIGKFGEVAKALDLPQEAAQQILDQVAPALQAQSMQAVSSFYKDIGGLPETWADQVRADKEIGGDKFADTMSLAAKARDAFGSAELLAVLNKTGLGDHPALIRAFARVGKAISEDTFVSGGSGAKAPASHASKLYGTT